MTAFQFTSTSEQDTERFGRALAESLSAGTTVALSGPLGAGKTRIVQALAAALGVPRETVTSPTFVLCQEYEGRLPIYHFDAYRLRDEDEFLRLGPEEYFQSPGIVLIEWAERVAGCLPEEHLELRIDVTGDTTRTITVRAVGAKYKPVIEKLAQGR